MRGRILQQGSIQELKQLAEGKIWTIQLSREEFLRRQNEWKIIRQSVQDNQFLLRVFLFYLLYLLLMFVMLLGVGSVIGINQIPPLAWQYGVQSFFYSGLGFLAMVLTRSTGWSLILVTSYLSLMILTRGQSLQFLDIYLHNTSIMSIESMIPFLRKVGLYGLILYANAQYFLSTSNRFKQ
jgi:hypothetical protein